MTTIGVCALALAACGGSGDDEADPAPADTEVGSQTTAVETTVDETTTEAPTTEASTTTEAPTTTRRTTTTTAPDPLTAALTAAGFVAPDQDLRDAIRTRCEEYSARNAEAINSSVGEEPGFLDLVRVAFGVECPDNVALVGVAVMPNGDPVFPGFPRIVDVSTIDSRVASSFEGNLIDGQVVALAPGVYTPYNPNVPDLIVYLTAPNDGDCVMRDQYFPETGGSCWNGVQPGTGEG